MNRRHLSREQKRALIAESLRADPELPDSDHAARTGSSDKTVASERERLEAVSEIPKLDYRVGKDGKRYPSKRVRQDSENVQTGQNPNAAPEPEPEPPAPSWEPAGHLHPADLAALNRATRPAETTKHPDLDPTTQTGP